MGQETGWSQEQDLQMEKTQVCKVMMQPENAANTST